jgi:hypothetical protein
MAAAGDVKSDRFGVNSEVACQTQAALSSWLDECDLFGRYLVTDFDVETNRQHQARCDAAHLECSFADDMEA